MHVHIDGDILIFRCGFAAEKQEYTLTYDDGEIVEKYTYKKDAERRIDNLGLAEGEYTLENERVVEPVENALYNVKSVINTILEAVGTDEYSLYLTGPGNYRYEIAKLKEYKGNRDPYHRPTHERALKDYMIKQWGAIVVEGEEADDAIGHSHYKMWVADPYSTVIASTDKDLDMIPGLHYNFVKDEQYEVDEALALYYFYKQLLTGDATDNIPGLPGVGEKRADRYLADITPGDESAYYEVAKKLYEGAYKADWKEVLVEQARLLWIRRHPDEFWKIPEER